MTKDGNATLPVKLSELPARRLNEIVKLGRLPDAWVQKIFATMLAHYGSLFSDRWRDCNMAEVKSVWAEELASFSDGPECYRLALKAMTNECRLPPTLPEFVALCRKNYARPKLVALEHKLTPEDIERNKERARKMAERLGRRFAA